MKNSEILVAGLVLLKGKLRNMCSPKLKNVIGVVLFSMLFAVDAKSLRAEEQDDIHPYLTAEFFVDLGVYFPSREVQFQVDGLLTGPNDDIDFEGEFGLDKSDQTFSLNFGWRFGEKWELGAQYFDASNGGGAVLEEDVEWGDVVFEQGSSISATTDFSVMRIFFGRNFESSSKRQRFGVGAGFHWIELGASIEGDAIIAGGANMFRRETVSAAAPLPNFGVWYMYSMSPKWAFKGRADWLDVDVGEIGGSLLNISIGVNYQIFEHVGVGLNYNSFDLDADVKKSNWRGGVKITYEGLYADLSNYW